MLESTGIVHRLIAEELSAGISSERIVVGGFSQGTALYFIALTTEVVRLRCLRRMVLRRSWLVWWECLDGCPCIPSSLLYGLDEMVLMLDAG
jgi:Phospholipase/Carboxylesterase